GQSAGSCHRNRRHRALTAIAPGATGTGFPHAGAARGHNPRCRPAAADNRSAAPTAGATGPARAASAGVCADRPASPGVVFRNSCRVISKFLRSCPWQDFVMSSITAIPALTDNYIWAIAPATAIAGSRVAIVDPGVAEPVQAWLTQHQFALGAILVTHHHGDHTAGIAELCAHQKAASGDEIPVFGPQAESDQIGQLTVPLAPGD